MSNKVTILVFVLILIVGFRYFTKQVPPTISPANIDASQVEARALDNVSAGAIDAGGVVSGSFEKTNPFDVKVSPYDGYRNPFAK